MELKVRTKEAITNPEQIAEIFQAIQKAENEIDSDEGKVLGDGAEYEEFHCLRRTRVDGDAQCLPGTPEGGLPFCDHEGSFRGHSGAQPSVR